MQASAKASSSSGYVRMEHSLGSELRRVFSPTYKDGAPPKGLRYARCTRKASGSRQQASGCCRESNLTALAHRSKRRYEEDPTPAPQATLPETCSLMPSKMVTYPRSSRASRGLGRGVAWL